MAKKIGKMNLKKVAINTVILGASGAVAQVLTEAVNLSNPDMMDYGLIVAGAVLPEVVKVPAVETASAGFIAVGAYRLAERKGLAGMIGFGDSTQTPATSGIRDYAHVGHGQPWKSGKPYAEKVSGKKTENASHVR